MFTGIVERTGRIIAFTGGSNEPDPALQMVRLQLDCGSDYPTALGDSVAVNGCCLTVVENSQNRLSFDVSRETLAKTNLALLRQRMEQHPATAVQVNLERALRVGDRLGGHIVTGHVDGKAQVERLSQDATGWDLRVRIDKALARYVIRKGSICLDGVSLTVNDLQDDDRGCVLYLMLIPTTVQMTSFKHLAIGQSLNVEVDTIGKFVERLKSSLP